MAAYFKPRIRRAVRIAGGNGFPTCYLVGADPDILTRDWHGVRLWPWEKILRDFGADACKQFQAHAFSESHPDWIPAIDAVTPNSVGVIKIYRPIRTELKIRLREIARSREAKKRAWDAGNGLQLYDGPMEPPVDPDDPASYPASGIDEQLPVLSESME
jgi:hypothetical protein